MATDGESLSAENQEEQLQDLTDEQLEQLLQDTLLVTRIGYNVVYWAQREVREPVNWSHGQLVTPKNGWCYFPSVRIFTVKFRYFRRYKH